METRYKTKRESFYNEEAHCWDFRCVEVPYYRYSDEEKLRIVSEHVKGKSAQEIVAEYHLSSKQVLFGWMDRFVNAPDLLSLREKQTEKAMTEQSPEARIAELEAETLRLEKALALERLRADAYDKMIDLAEEAFNIPIRKKSGTKQ